MSEGTSLTHLARISTAAPYHPARLLWAVRRLLPLSEGKPSLSLLGYKYS